MILVEEDISALHVSVEDLQLMEGLETTHHLNNDLPDMLLLDELLIVLAFTDSLKNVAIVSKLHHNAERVRGLIKESLTVGSDERILDTRQNTNLIQSVLLLSIGQVLNLDFLERVNLIVLQALDLVDARVRSVT